MFRSKQGETGGYEWLPVSPYTGMALILAAFQMLKSSAKVADILSTKTEDNVKAEELKVFGILALPELSNNVGLLENSLLYHLIRTLSISTERVFYPELAFDGKNLEMIVSMLYRCDERDLKVIAATLNALLEGK